MSLPAGSANAQVWTFDPVKGVWEIAGADAGDPGGSISGGVATIVTKHLSLFAVTLGALPTPVYSATPAGTPALLTFLPSILADGEEQRAGW